MAKIVNERRELVKLCDINFSGPVLFETHCIIAFALQRVN